MVNPSDAHAHTLLVNDEVALHAKIGLINSIVDAHVNVLKKKSLFPIPGIIILLTCICAGDWYDVVPSELMGKGSSVGRGQESGG